MSSTSTFGVRTWRRTTADSSAPLAERVAETTRPDAMPAAIASADFVTIPRESESSSGYGSEYAAAFGAALAEQFSYAGVRRVSTSGRSHVFERQEAPQGAAVDLGPLSGAPSVKTSQTGNQRPPVPSGDGSVLGRPALATR